MMWQELETGYGTTYTGTKGKPWIQTRPVLVYCLVLNAHISETLSGQLLIRDSTLVSYRASSRLEIFND